MSTNTHKRKNPFVFSYERRYHQLFKYPRRSEIKEAFIRYNIYSRINLNKKVNGVTRLRDRKKISYAIDLESSPVERFQSVGSNKLSAAKGSRRKGSANSLNTSFLNNRGLDSIAMVDSSNNAKHEINVCKKPLITRKPRSKKVGRPKNISAKAKKEPKLSDIKPENTKEVEEEVFDDIIFVKGESPDPEDFKQNDIYTVLARPSDTIKISNKDIKRIINKHCPLSGKILTKPAPCMLCDMKLYNYIIHKRIQSTMYTSSSMMLDF